MTPCVLRLAPMLAAALLSACAQTSRPGRTTPVVQDVTNKEQISDVVSALESGDVKRARKLLKKMAQRDPGDSRVKALSTSIEAEPVAALGSRSFGYDVQSGDTLSSLSQRFLGNRLKFYLLARYNGLKKVRIARGMSLRIPGVEPTPPAVVVLPRAEPQAPKSAPAATASQPTALSVANPALAIALRGRALAALNQGRIGVAVVNLRRARAVDPGNAAVQRDLLRAERLLATVKARK